MDGITKNDKIKVSLFLNPFSIHDKKEYYTERKNIGIILSDNGLNFTKDLAVIDTDKIVYGNNTIPFNDHLIIRAFPTGTGNQNQDIAVGEKVAGGLLTVGGVVLAIAGAAIPGLSAIGVAVAGTGVSLFIGGVVLFNSNVSLPEYEDTQTLPSIKGSRNRTRPQGKVPILLGKHRIFPDNASLPYVNTDGTTSIQTLNQLYCAGFANMEIDEDTIKIGETFFRPNSSNESTVFTNAKYNIKYGETSPYTYYEGRRVDINYGEKLVYTDAVGQIPLVKTTSSNTKKLYVRLSFPNGLIRYNDDGDKKSTSVSVRVEYKKAEEDDSAYAILDEDIILPTPIISARGVWSTGDFTIDNIGTSIQETSKLYQRVEIGSELNTPNFPNGTKITNKRFENNGFNMAIGLDTPATGSGANTLFEMIPPLPESPYSTTISATTATAFRKVFEYDLDNLSPAGDDYSASRQYDIRVTRVSKQGTSTKIVDDVLLESIKTENGVFDNVSSFDDTPIIEAIKERITLFELNIQATDQLKNVIDEINFEGTLKTRDYSGIGSGVGAWTADTLTRNPASMFLYVLTNSDANQHPIDDSKIDFPALEAWHDFCDTKSFTCDAYVNYDVTTNQLLDNICLCGRASWNIVDGLYTIIVDNTKSDIVQMFTPRNSFNYNATKSFPDKPTVLKSQFVNSESGYVQEEISIYNKRISGTSSITAGTSTLNGTSTLYTTELAIGDSLQIGTETREVQSITNDTTLVLNAVHGLGASSVSVYIEDNTVSASSNTFGVTESDHAWKLGKYQLAVAELRPIVHTFSADIENIVCTRGDRIKFRHDVPLYGLFDGRIKEVLDNATNIIGFISDEIIAMETGKSYSVRIRQNNGSFSDQPVTNPGTGNYTTLTFVTPITGLTAIEEYNLFTFGETGSQDIDLIISDIKYASDFQATLTCVDYSPEIFDADTGTIPLYESKISVAGDGASSINPENIQDVNGTLEATVEVITSNTESLTARFPDSFQSNLVDSYYFTTDGDFTYYVNYEGDHKIYKKTIDQVNNGTPLNTESSACMAYFGSTLIYVNQDNGSVLFKKSIEDTLDGDAVTTNTAWCPTVDESGNCYYINYDDSNKVYVIDITGSGGNDVLFLDKACVWISYLNGFLFYMESDGIVHSYELSTTTDTAITTDEVNKFTVLDEDELIISKADDLIAYSIDYDGTNETPEFVGADFVYGFEGTLLYSSASLDNNIYPALENKVADISVLEANPSYATITGDIVTGLNTITGLSNPDLDKLAKGDTVIGTGIPDDTIINMIGAGYIYISNSATTTSNDLVFEISGSRIFLNANKVIVPGTIEAELLQADAINSKNRADDGNPLTEINLNDGTYQFRKQNGTIVLDFDANRTDDELILAGTMTITGGSIDGTTTIDGTDASVVVTDSADGSTAFDGTVKYRSTGAPTNTPTPSGITITQNNNASMDIELNWSSYTQGANQADMLLLFWNQTTSAPTVDDSCISFNVNTAGASYYVFEGLNPSNTYSFGIAGARRTENGLEIGAIQSPTTTPDWRGVGNTTPNYTANVGGTAATTVVSEANNGQDAFTNTTSYRSATAPTNDPAPTAQVLSLNTDGTYDIELSWTYADGALPADRLTIFYEVGDNTTPSAPTVNSSAISFNTGTTGTQKYKFTNLPGLYIVSGASRYKHYTFAIASGRSINTGTVYGALQSPTTTPDWVDLSNSNAKMDGGLIKTGAIQSVVEVSGNPVSEIDLDSGDITMRDSSGNIVLSFDNDATSPLSIVGDINADSFSVTTGSMTTSSSYYFTTFSLASFADHTIILGARSAGTYGVLTCFGFNSTVTVGAMNKATIPFLGLYSSGFSSYFNSPSDDVVVELFDNTTSGNVDLYFNNTTASTQYVACFYQVFIGA